MYSPWWVPVTEALITTLSPSAIRSSIVRCRSGRPRRSIAHSCRNASCAPGASTGNGMWISTSGATTSSIVVAMTSTSPVLTASWMRLNLALLLVVSWAADIWFLLTAMCMRGGCERPDLPADRLGRDPGRRTPGGAARRPGRLVSRPGCQDARPGARPRTAARQDRGGSSGRPQQRGEVGDRPEAGQLVGVDDRADAGDLAAGDLDRHHGDQPLLRVEPERSRAAVDLDRAQRHPRQAGAQPGPLDQRPRDPAAAAQRPRQPPDLAAAGPGRLHVVGEQRLQPRQVAVLDGREEPPRQLLVLLARRVEARPALPEVAPRSHRELAHVARARADDRRDLRVVV